ncbi:MAG: serine/threonine protein kinase, partial [Ilumatobacter sp.]|nr:serine/threonine protein kinase [Ilumatobacter sp.]
DRPVAIKIFQGAPDDQSLNDFLRECRALGALDWCGNIITVFGTGRTRHGEPYLAMEYCPGGSLSTHLTEGATMSEAQVRHIAAEVGTAIQIAHDAGILHRDIKPANILLSRSGAPVLADFGIARLANSSTRSTGISGTIAFTAPEILNGEAATRQADIYSYGATLYSLLTGRSPHALTDRDTTQTMIVRAVSGEGADLTTLPISDDFRAVLARCL